MTRGRSSSQVETESVGKVGVCRVGVCGGLRKNKQTCVTVGAGRWERDFLCGTFVWWLWHVSQSVCKLEEWVNL